MARLEDYHHWQRNLAMLLKDNLQGIQHLGIPVADLERSKNFYSRLGFTEVMRTDLTVQNGVTRVAMMRHENLTIELYQQVDAQYQHVSLIRDGYIDHVAMNVLDIDSAYAEIKRAGLEVIESNAPVFLPFWEDGVSFFTIRGPDGEKIEFNQLL